MQRTKYPRTFHLPWSLGAKGDDKTLSIEEVRAMFEGREVVVTEKMDGENTTIYPDGYTHARSMDSAHHPSRSWVKALAAQVQADLPEELRVCGENMYALHSVEYDRLTSFFLTFSIWEGSEVLSWDETEEWCALLDLPTVPVLWRGVWNDEAIQSLWPFESRQGQEPEGYVVRWTSRLTTHPGAGQVPVFDGGIAKFVRKDHVQTDEHWSHRPVVPNTLA